MVKASPSSIASVGFIGSVGLLDEEELDGGKEVDEDVDGAVGRVEHAAVVDRNKTVRKLAMIFFLCIEPPSVIDCDLIMTLKASWI